MPIQRDPKTSQQKPRNPNKIKTKGLEIWANRAQTTDADQIKEKSKGLQYTPL